MVAGIAGRYSLSPPPRPAQTAPQPSIEQLQGRPPAEAPLQAICAAVQKQTTNSTAELSGLLRLSEGETHRTIWSAERRPEGSVAKADTAPESCTELNPEFASGLKVVVAFVPDPERTALRLYFDRALEAIQSAAQDSGYQFHTYWLPWTATPTPEPSNFNDRRLFLEERRRRRGLPGILAYRGMQGNPGLAVFLVGEMPTGFFSRDQFYTALRYQRSLAPAQAGVWIVGPCYSGALDTLRTAIQAQGEGFREFHVLSGTTTNPQAGANFRQAFSHSEPWKVTYHSLIHDDDVTTQTFHNYLATTLKVDGGLATLSEGETVFGNYVPSSASPDHCLRIRFPRGLSHLRNAYQTEFNLAALADANENSQARRTLQLNLKDAQEGLDSPPEFAPQTSVSHESELSQIAETLQHERIKFVEVSATDELHRIFVGHFLRAAAPDTRIVLFNADLLSGRFIDGNNLNGTIQVTTYPLFLASQNWTQIPALTRHIAFSSTFEEAIYNASSVAFGSGADETSGSSQLLDYEQPKGNSGTPPIWITAVGRDGTWPIAVLRPDERTLRAASSDPFILVNKSGKSGSTLTMERRLPPRAWLLLFLFGLLSTLAYLYAFRRAEFTRDRWCADFSYSPRRPGEAGRIFHLLILTLIGAIVWLTVLSAQLGFLFVQSGTLTNKLILLTFLGLPILVFAVLVFTGIQLSGRIVRIAASRQDDHRRIYVHLLALPWLVFLLYVTFILTMLSPEESLRGFFFAYRSQEFGSGLCPIIPLLLIFAALGVWSFVHWQRVIFSQERYQFVPAIEHRGEYDALCASVTELNKSFQVPFPGPLPLLYGIASIVVLIVIPMGYRSIRSLEGWVFDYFFIACIGILCGLLSLAVTRFWLSWRLLMRILEQLELHPIREAFTNLPADHSWSPIWQHSPRKRNYVVLSRALECLQQLHRMKVAIPYDCDAPGGLEYVARDLLQYVAEGRREPTLLYRALQQALNDTAQAIADQLKESYWARGGSETLRKAASAEATKDILKPTKEELEHDKPFILLQEFVAMRFLSYIRYVMVQLRNLLTFITFGFVLMVLCLGSYPFQSPHVIAWFLGLSLIAIGVPVVWVFMEMGRDAILSRITDTRAGKLDWEFYVRTAAFGALPLLSLLASHFPAIGQYISSWVQPALKALH
jgi:hypothetical protein